MSFDIVELKEALPKQHRSKITPQFIDDLNQMVADPDFGELYAKNAVTYATVLQEGRFKLTDYFNAVAFVSHKMLGMSSMAAYQKVFPDKVKDMVARNISNKDMQAYASTYNKNKLVTLIYEQTLIPDHIMYASIRHKAIAAQAALLSSTNEHIVQKAADSLMNHLKAPESAKLTLDIGTNDTGVIADLANAVANLSNQQRGKIIEGAIEPKEVAHSPILSNEDEE
ncbi:hypothetical protein [Vibrio phage BUCT194]|uniref:Uncharacterized protein n=1 Tax=Vibrio phage BUCT194 TaxID=2859072 RepID=A0AAE9BP74_9CAUD|nr:hypothetical protein PP741_gp060 [Vibrio phage BUCT194]UAW01165.1 hypothetical protein [Vibrio phage BUCT194]